LAPLAAASGSLDGDALGFGTGLLGQHKLQHAAMLASSHASGD